NAREESPVPPGQDEGGTEGKTELWQALHGKCGELSALVLRADDPGLAAAYVLHYLPKHLEYVFEVVRGQKRRPVLGDLAAGCQVAPRQGEHHAGSAWPVSGSNPPAGYLAPPPIPAP